MVLLCWCCCVSDVGGDGDVHYDDVVVAVVVGGAVDINADCA